MGILDVYTVMHREKKWDRSFLSFFFKKIELRTTQLNCKDGIERMPLKYTGLLQTESLPYTRLLLIPSTHSALLLFGLFDYIFSSLFFQGIQRGRHYFLLTYTSYPHSNLLR